MYHCAECQSLIVVAQGEGGVVIVRSCACDAAIVADMTASLEGEGGVR